MNIYFSCSIVGGRADQPVYAALVDHLQARGHAVPTAALAAEGILEEEAEVDPGAVYARDVAWVNGAQALIAEVSTPSHGVGYEIALGLGRGLPVLCLYRAGAKVSKMLLGNTEPGLRLGAYGSVAEALALVEAFLATAGA